MSFPCPACGEGVPGDPSRWALRCGACGARLRSRARDTGDGTWSYEVQAVGRPETRRVVEIAWDRHQAGRLARWLLWSTVLTIALTVLLLAAAHLRR